MENGGVNAGGAAAANASKEGAGCVVRDKESEMEAALYGNCLLLGLDANILGQVPGSRAGLFRHSNPRVGEALLHFLLSALRGPSLAAKDFAGVWPIFDAAQSRDFRKIVQSLINELEAQGALPRSSSRVSSLATCCGQRFVELLWQLSAHALREVHRRNFAADVAVNPLPASLTEVITQNSHASALLAVTKARIALERRRFLQGAVAAVQKQALWSSLAHDMTAEYRALCAEEAYLHQELEKIQELNNSRGQAHSGNQKAISAARASLLWETLLKHTERHEKLATGPIEDLIAHREHRYRIDGSALRMAIDRGTNVVPNGLMLIDEDSTQQLDGRERYDTTVHGDENRADRSMKGPTPVDVAEVLRRWTHALQRIHKQALKLARSNEGAGPELIKDALKSGADVRDGHAHALRATLAEHKQHLSNMQALIGQLKESVPGMETAIAALRQQVNNPAVLSASAASQAALSTCHASSDLSFVREATPDYATDEKSSPGHLELAPPSPTLKLPQLPLASPLSFGRKSHGDDEDSSMVFSRHTNFQDGFQGFSSLRQAVHEAALSKSAEVATETPLNASEHYFTPVAARAAVDKLTGDEFGVVELDGQAKHKSESRKEAGNGRTLSPPLLVELSSFHDDDLLAPMLDMDTALI